MVIPAFIRRLSLAGVDESMDVDLAKGVTICNQLCFALGSLCVPYIFVFLRLSLFVEMWGAFLLGSIYAGIIFLNSRRYHTAARLLFFFLTNISNFCFSLLLGPGAGIQLFFFATLAMPLLLFTRREKISMTAGVLCSIALRVAFEAVRDYRGDWHVLPPGIERGLFYVMLFTSQGFLLTVICVFLLGNRRAEAALFKAVESAKAADRAKSQFLANMSHEIRTPLNGILGLTALLARSPRPDQAEPLSAIQTSATDLLAIINDILDLSKIEAGRMQLENIPFDLRKLVDPLMNLLKPQAEAKGLQLRLDWPAGLSERFMGDPVRLKQVLANLLGNALKFTKDGSVKLCLRPGQGYAENIVPVLFEVEDTGIGISPKEQERIFQPFSQADPSTTRRFGGTGLGLHICRQIVGMMGGTISLRSQPGEGTTFSFTLPLALAPPPEPARREKAVPAAAPADGALDEETALKRAKDLRILIVEDHPINQRVLESMLSVYGCRAEKAADGRVALEACASKDFDLIFMDSHMPEMDGYECTRRLRGGRAPEAGRAPYIAGCTADAMPVVKQQCMDAGMDDLITKPIMERELRRVLVTVIRRLPEGFNPAMETAEKLLVAAMQRTQVPARDESWVDPALLDQMDTWIRQYQPGFWDSALREFETTYARHGTAMRAAFLRGDYHAAGETAHSLKGVCLMLGMQRLAEVCRDLEALGLGGDSHGWPALMEDLEAGREPTLRALKEHVKKG